MKSALVLFLFSFSSLLMAQNTDPLKTAEKELEQKTKQEQKRLKQIDKVVAAASKYIGAPFKDNGKSKNGIDEANLLKQAFKAGGVELPGSLEAISSSGKRIYIGELEKGDVLFFALSSGSKKLKDAGVVSRIDGGDVYFIQASKINGVREKKLNDPKWKDRYVMAKRLL